MDFLVQMELRSSFLQTKVVCFMATLRKRYSYNCSIDDVVNYFATDECFRLRMSAQNAETINFVSQQGLEFRYTFTVKRELPSFLPRLMRKQLSKLSDSLLVSQSEMWSRKSQDLVSYHMLSELEQFKIKVESASIYSSTPTGCVNDMVMEISCGLPLVGSKLADYVCADNEVVMDNEYELLQSMLLENRLAKITV